EWRRTGVSRETEGEIDPRLDKGYAVIHAGLGTNVQDSSMGGLFDSNNALFDYLFDTNSVRDFARRIRSEAEWEKLRAVWKKKRYKTVWIPWTIGEVLGTNLAGSITAKDCKEVAIAVRRFDQIAGRDILFGPR